MSAIDKAADLIHALYHALDDTAQHMGGPDCQCHESEAFIMDKDTGEQLNAALDVFTDGDMDAHEAIAALREYAAKLTAAEHRASVAENALKPFARAAQNIPDRLADGRKLDITVIFDREEAEYFNATVVVERPEVFTPIDIENGRGFPSHLLSMYSATVGDLRKAYSILHPESQPK